MIEQKGSQHDILLRAFGFPISYDLFYSIQVDCASFSGKYLSK